MVDVFTTYNIIIAVMAVAIGALGYAVRNLLRKLETQEDIVVSYLQYIDEISRVIELSDEQLQKADQKGHFEGDDEVGFIYNEIKDIQTVLSTFRVDKL